MDEREIEAAIERIERRVLLTWQMVWLLSLVAVFGGTYGILAKEIGWGVGLSNIGAWAATIAVGLSSLFAFHHADSRNARKY